LLLLLDTDRSAFSTILYPEKAVRSSGAAFFLETPMSPKPAPGRAEAAARIVENPARYKVCEGCDSIVGSGTAICPNCHSFRFDATSERVVTQAHILGAREQTSVTMEDLG